MSHRSNRETPRQDLISRRHFLEAGVSALAGASMLASHLDAQIASSTRPVLHIIGHSHIDAAWLWPWKDSADLVLTTFRSALDRMQETPGFRYSHSSVMHYRWAQQADPALFAEVLDRIREGRWEVVGGWPVEPDCNIPSTESFARHCLYGKRFCEQILKVNVDIGFNPDSFGHAAGLPTILRHAGYGFYVFMRPQEHEMDLPRLFWWEGPDGSRLLTYRIFGDYDRKPTAIRDAATQGFPSGSNHNAFFLGVGDHGGAVTRSYIQQILAMQSDPTLPELRWSTLREFFAALRASMSFESLPVIRGDLQHHARGCYSACGEEKVQNRRAEQQLFCAETAALVAAMSYAQPYPAARFAEAWDRVLFTQFHDVLAGTSLFSDYQDARDALGFACEIAQESKVAHLQLIAKQVDLHDVPEGAVFAWNSLPWRRKALLEFHYATNATSEQYTALKAADGTLSALQLRPSDSMTNFYPRLSAWVDLPACGYRVFTLERTAAASAPPISTRSVLADRAFGLSALLAEDGANLLAANLGLIVIEDTSDTWAHGIAAFRKELGRPTLVSSEVAETGPVTRVTRQHLQWKRSTITVDITQSSGTDAVELRFVVDWQEHEEILKLEVPTRLLSAKVVAKVPGAALERAANGNEEPYQDWVCLEGLLNGRTYTVGLINAATYSYDCLDGTLRTVLIRSAPYARHNPNPVLDNGINAWQDQGRQERVFWLLSCAGAAQDLAMDRRAIALQTPAEYVLDSRHAGTQPRERSFLEITPAHVEVLALKKEEQGSNFLIRLQERSGQTTTANLHFPATGEMREVPLLPWEIKSVVLTHPGASGRTLRAVSILET